MLLCILAEAFFGEDEGVRQSRNDYVEGLAEERGSILCVRIGITSTSCFACIFLDGDSHRGDGRR
jgi:hypothetical protein